MSTRHRTMPIRCAPQPGEALDSWLEFTAARLTCPFTDVLSALGLPNRETATAALVLPAWTIRLTRDERAAITAVTGIAEDVLTAMTLQPFDGHAVDILPRHRRVNRRVLWGRAGSRFCPLCLADTGGRWPVTWRLSWSFACTRHHVLLADRCPACHRIPRLRSHPRRDTPRPGRCSSAAPDSGPRPPRCHHPLTDTPATAIPADGDLAEAQRFIDTALTAPGRRVRWPLYGLGGAPLKVVLRDTKTLGALVLNHATPDDLGPLAAPNVLDRLEHYRAHPLPVGSQRSLDTRHGDLHSHVAPGDAAATAVAVSAAFRILRAENTRSAARAAEWLTGRMTASGRPLYPGNVVALGGAISPALEATLRCSRESKLMPVARLRHRTGVDSTRPPTDHNARARLLPAGLWPEWTLRLTPRHASGRPVAQRAEELLAVACLLAGNTTPIRYAVRLTGTTVTSHNVSTFLATLTRHPDGADILRAVILLADHLDTNSAPIDYARRRALFTTRPQFIDARAWLELQRRLRSNLSPNPVHAQRWLFHTLTGSPAHPDIAPATPAQRQHYQRFCWRILPAEAELLRHTARRLLDEHGINEPLQWTPQLPDRALHGLQLPGPDPHTISPERLHQAVPGSDFSIAQLARTLETTTAHVVHLLSEHPVDWSPPRFRRTQHTATRTAQWRQWYERDRLSLQAIADLEETTLATIRLALLKNGTQLRPAGSRPGRPRRK
ncbi:TniQ family protein [Streptomyces sp. NPDC012616]|uniref:TniQ family protein n=1 Tax=Streptomyces sp. NPDC012616 TaxID=3364840 RepID=UPI0036EB9DF1